MQMIPTSLLRCLIVASVSFPVSVFLAEVCVKAEPLSPFRCENCDMEGRNYTSVTWLQCDVKSIYTHLNATSDAYTGPLSFILENNNVIELPQRLFPANIEVILVWLRCEIVTSIPDNLFVNQENNIREVILITNKISVYPPNALNSLTRLQIIMAIPEEYYNPTGPATHIRSFNSLLSKHKLITVRFMFTHRNVTFDCDALASLTKLRNLGVRAKWIDTKTFVDVLPTNWTSLRNMELQFAELKKYPAEMVQEIERRVTVLDSFNLKYVRKLHLTRNDWTFLINSVKFKKLHVSSSVVGFDCTCDMMPVVEANAANKSIDISGYCSTPDGLQGMQLKQLTSCSFPRYSGRLHSFSFTQQHVHEKSASKDGRHETNFQPTDDG